MKWQLMTCAASLEDEMNKQDWNNSGRLFILNYKQKLINYSPCLNHAAGSCVDRANTHTEHLHLPFFFLLAAMFGGMSMLENTLSRGIEAACVSLTLCTCHAARPGAIGLIHK